MNADKMVTVLEALLEEVKKIAESQKRAEVVTKRATEILESLDVNDIGQLSVKLHQ